MKVYMYIAVMALVTYLIRVIPLTVFNERKPVPSVISVLCTVYLSDGYDISGYFVCNRKSEERLGRGGSGSRTGIL